MYALTDITLQGMWRDQSRRASPRVRLIMWKLAALASLALCAAQTPAAPDATTGKAAPNVTVTEARPAPQPKRAHE